jgi:hypothetical protein
MPITEIAISYLDALKGDVELDGGLSFQNALSQLNLDYSRESLSSD